MNLKNLDIYLTGIITLCTAVYTVINILMLKESQKTRKQKTSPSVIAYLKTSETHKFLYLYIKNIGEGYARNLKGFVVSDYNVYGKADFKLSDRPLFTSGITMFPPDYEIKYGLNFTQSNHLNDETKFIELKLEYDDMSGKHYYSENFKLYFKQISSSFTNPPDTYIGNIANELKQLNDNVSKLMKDN